MAHRTITTPDELDALTTLLGNLKLPITVEWVQGRDRTRDQNALQFLWATEAANQRGDVTTDEVRREWKLRYGVPILREDSEDFRQLYDRMIKPLPYPMKLEAMRLIPVSSEMKVRQMVRYLDTIQRECAEQGIKLTDPDPELASYQARYRQTANGASSMTDPMEKMVADALTLAGIAYTTDFNGGNPSGLDFRLTGSGVEIEVKQFHSPRIAEQMARADNVIALQGERAVRLFCGLIAMNEAAA